MPNVLVTKKCQKDRSRLYNVPKIAAVIITPSIRELFAHPKNCQNDKACVNVLEANSMNIQGEKQSAGSKY